MEWYPNFDTSEDRTENVLVWVRFPSIPIEYYKQDFLMRIVRKIGRPVKVDHIIGMMKKGHYAPVFVEVDITKPLLLKFKIK